TAAAGGYEVEGGDVVCDVPDLVVTMWRQRWWLWGGVGWRGGVGGQRRLAEFWPEAAPDLEERREYDICVLGLG
ncbi:hypothetical protein Tco_0477976, partial [Tanacetum coccineum]